MKKKTHTSWGEVAGWYSEHVESNDTYHEKVIAPNLLRMLSLKPSMQVLEIGCGEGYFSRLMAKSGAQVTATDIAPELIALATKKGGGPVYATLSAEKLTPLSSQKFDLVVAILTVQNMERIDMVFSEVARVLKKHGSFFIVLNHPTFRVPKRTSWGYDGTTETQYRRIDGYLSQSKEKIIMHPGKTSGTGAGQVTYSFHRSLQDYMKALCKNNFAITRLEEWISHRTSVGAKSKAENKSRSEIPLFMAIECRKF